MSKVYVIVSMDGGIPHVEAVLRTEEAARSYLDELVESSPNIGWEYGDNNGNCIAYAACEDGDSDIRVYERNLL